MSATKKLEKAANSASYPTLAETKLERRAFLVGAGAVVAAAVGCGGLNDLSGGAPVSPPDASLSGGPDSGSPPPPDSSVPDPLAGAAPLDPPDAGSKPPGQP
ncbi:MAG: twin-arginine translocation signal domain-containing protein [Myxococcales bacterium]